MAHCNYHPLKAATFFCNKCDKNFCDACIDNDQRMRGPSCFLCSGPLELLGGGHDVKPFWRRLEDTFRYPTNKNAVTFIVTASIFSTLLSFAPGLGLISVLAYLAVSGAIFKYCLTCLLNTAHGDMQPPDLTDAFSGGISVMLKLFGLVLILSVGVGVLSHYLPPLAGLLGAIVLIAFPAMLIRFAQNEDVFEAANPVAAIQLIFAIGLPYGLLLGFIVVMMGSMGVLNQLVGTHLGFISIALQSVIGNYYLVVLFHLAGYMLFQYQSQLGYAARLTDDELTPRSAADNALARIKVLLKEGDIQAVEDAYRSGMKLYSQDARFTDQYLDLLCKAKNKDKLLEFADTFLDKAARRTDRRTLDLNYNKIRHLCPGYVPSSALARHQIAEAAHRKGDLKLAIALLNGLHKTHLDYPKLTEAYQLLADCLTKLPGGASKAATVHSMIDKIAIKQAELAASPKSRPSRNKPGQSNQQGPAEDKSLFQLDPIEFKKDSD